MTICPSVPSNPGSEKDAKDAQEMLTKIANSLYNRFGRFPTTEEVHGMIFGDEETRLMIWNFGLPETINKEN